MLVLVYTGATDTEFLPYLASVFAPLVPVFIWSRDAKRTQCPPKEALWYTWLDCILPFIRASRTPADTLFIVAEADWCLSGSHEQACAKYLNETSRRWVLCDPVPTTSPADPSDVASSPSAQPKTEPRRPSQQGGRKRKGPHGGRKGDRPAAERGYHEWWHPTRLRRPPTVGSGELEPSSPFLDDIVYMCNTAAAHQQGDLVWLSYATFASKKNKQIGNGSTALALTRFGAEHMHQWMQQSSAGHIDLKLLEMLRKPPSAQPVEAARLLQEHSCYIWNSVGGYRAHLSGCDPKQGERACDWSKDPVQEWTRQVRTERPNTNTERWAVRAQKGLRTRTKSRTWNPAAIPGGTCTATACG